MRQDETELLSAAHAGQPKEWQSRAQTNLSQGTQDTGRSFFSSFAEMNDNFMVDCARVNPACFAAFSTADTKMS